MDRAERINAFLIDELGVDPGAIGSDEALFTSRMLSSMDIVTLVTFLESEFDIEISPLDVSFELFDRPSLIARYVESTSTHS